MKQVHLELLSDSALDELKAMESEQKIRLLNDEDLRRLDDKRSQIWKELEEYTYENILKKIKESA